MQIIILLTMLPTEEYSLLRNMAEGYRLQQKGINVSNEVFLLHSIEKNISFPS